MIMEYRDRWSLMKLWKDENIIVDEEEKAPSDEESGEDMLEDMEE